MAGTLLDLLGLTDPAAAIIAAATGGSVAPVGASGAASQAASQADPAAPTADPAAASTTPPATGSTTSTLPAHAASAGGGDADPWAALVRLVAAGRRKPALKAMTQAGQGGEANAAAANAKRFGGDVLGFGTREGKGDYAVVRKGGQLYHIYAQHGNKNNVKLNNADSGVARALGLGQGDLALVKAGRHRGGHRDMGSGADALSPMAAQTPVGDEGVTPQGPAGHRIPMMENHRVPPDPLTGALVTPQVDGASQAAAATTGDVPMTAAEAYRRRLMAAHARLGLH